MIFLCDYYGMPIESKLKSIESELKSIKTKLKLIEIYHVFGLKHIQSLVLYFFYIKERPKIV